jgi:hypothetical protein
MQARHPARRSLAKVEHDWRGTGEQQVLALEHDGLVP